MSEEKSFEDSPREEEKSEESHDKEKKGAWWKPALLVAVVAILFFVSPYLGLGEKMENLRGWFESLGVWGPLAFIAVYIGATVGALPGSPLTVIAGAVFGTFWGVIYVSIASTTGAALAFLIARYFARDAVKARLEDSEKFQELDKLVESEGAIIVAITRLVPIFPFNLLNYGFGLTGVNFWTYVFWSWLCMLPGTAMYVSGADIVARLAQGEIPWVLLLFLIAIVAVIVQISRRARKYLKEKEEKHPELEVSKEET